MPARTRSVRSQARARDFGQALDGWGHFTDAGGLDAPPGEWIRADGELIRGGLDRTQLDLLSVSAPGLVVTRMAEHVARTPDVKHIVVVQLEGTSVLTPTDGRPPVHLGPGDLSYGDPTVPYRWEFEGPLSLMMLRVPFAAFPLAPASLRPILGQPYSSREGFARLAVGFARDVLADADLLGGPTAPRIVQNVVDLFATMLAGRLAETHSDDPTQPAFRRVIGYIAERLTPPSLTQPLGLPQIARAVDMSPRYVQSLFQLRGMTVSGWIRQRRLEVARQALADPAWAGADIAQVAAAHGFSDHSHFTRVFRSAYGETPSRWRSDAG
ncbi:AraC family transcriptional regulator [Microbacterium murale]|uniref:AraC family transcriptional regulator n=1 Tax=Microbacterium murale TaxID=1081040 RepID=A0ABQ1RD45_9MICO|nr:AraC family transcriptional regulator [Microbacterium murale]GGD65749.1 AraC family transcriptional regulator [Microbacterium murale]